ncbi:hypothetical protein BGX24_011327 [Mortierella sp. AD032]|nr:hypothetical protein BGX24_011327 [Mortierella sp. AD032]
MKHLNSSKITKEGRSEDTEKSKWGSQEVQGFRPYPKGTTMGELYDGTHKVHIFKVTLEEKVFET